MKSLFKCKDFFSNSVDGSKLLNVWSKDFGGSLCNPWGLGKTVLSNIIEYACNYNYCFKKTNKNILDDLILSKQN